jgi:YbbR domain-containing protein
VRLTSIWPFGHLGLKALSVALALLLWMVVSGEETVERGLRVPLELQQLPAGLELNGDIPATVDVRVRGASGTLGRVSASDIIAVLDLRGAQAGRRLFPLTPEQFRAPFGVEVVQVQPSAIALAVEPSLSRQVPVMPAVDGHPAPGYSVGALTAEPKTVEVIGPESAVRRVTEALTEPVSVDGAREPIRQSVTLGLIEPSLRLKNTRVASVTVDIVPAPLERTLRGRPVHLRNTGATVEAQAIPSTVDLTLRGSRDALARVDADDVTAYVDVGGLGPGQYTLDVHADASRDAGVARIEPSSVQVRIISGKR